ncbi:hypothetical protein GXM_01569 [Nostoc sphaeroides CCNUC1]|uniref:Uncharacterized protein n=1 Tax=Nostoc sphaeroides CCNUC1 TaxID=2653204 RepID=A0A5P8VVD6_9NOSO|nr:hypothetical protein GXM_01569 [Nostoc sphaeroides CCNUC1]
MHLSPSPSACCAQLPMPHSPLPTPYSLLPFLNSVSTNGEKAKWT